jgi:outer membrane protein insertion porin family
MRPDSGKIGLSVAAALLLAAPRIVSAQPRPPVGSAQPRPPIESAPPRPPLESAQPPPPIGSAQPPAVEHIAPPPGGDLEKNAPVDEVRVIGNHRVEDSAIKLHVRSRAAAPLDPATVERDIREIYDMGFFEDVRAEMLNEKGRRILVYRVVERPLVKEVKIEGTKKLTEEDVQTALKVRPRTILDLGKVHEGIEEAKKLYDQKGYKDAKIAFQVSPPDAAGEVVLTFNVDEGKIVRVEHIEFEGNQSFSDRQLKRILQTKEAWFLSWVTGAGNLDADVLKTDGERLTAWYYENGYVNVRIDEPNVQRVDDGLQVTFKIDEGKQHKIGKVDIAGDLIAPKPALAKSLSTQTGDTFKASDLRKDILALTEFYGDNGYAFTNVEPETSVNAAKQAVDITFKIDKGPRVYFNRIEITGNTKTRDDVIRRELKVQEQQLFSGTLLKDSRARIQRLGFFQEVNLATKKSEQPDQIDLVIDVKEAPTGAFTAGAGFSSADRFVISGRLSENNLFGSGDRVSLNVDFGAIRQDYSIDYVDPYFLDTYFTASFSAFNTRLEFDDFTRSGRGFTTQFLYPFTALGLDRFAGLSLDEVRFGLEYQLDQADIGNLDFFFRVPSIDAEEGKTLTSSVIPTLVRNTLNHPFDPTDGSVQDVSVEFAGLGGDTDYLKVESRARWFYPFYRSPSWGTFVASAGGRVGYGLGEGGRDGKELPLFERFFPGGINSVRGFRTRTLGPREPVFAPDGTIVDTTPVGGSSQLIMNGELIFPLIEELGLRGVVFFDAGNAFSRSQGLDVAELRYAYGWGVRWLSPIGPLRLEIGYPIARRRGEKNNVFQFSFGAPL